MVFYVYGIQIDFDTLKCQFISEYYNEIKCLNMDENTTKYINLILIECKKLNDTLSIQKIRQTMGNIECYRRKIDSNILKKCENDTIVNFIDKVQSILPENISLHYNSNYSQMVVGMELGIETEITLMDKVWPTDIQTDEFEKTMKNYYYFEDCDRDMYLVK